MPACRVRVPHRRSSNASITISESSSGSNLKDRLVEIHSGMEAAGLLRRLLPFPAQLSAIAGPRRAREEPECVEVRAAQRHRFDDGVGAVRPEPEGHIVAQLSRRGTPSPTRAARSSRSARGGARSSRADDDELDRLFPSNEQIEVGRHTAPGSAVPAQPRVRIGTRAGQLDPESGVPARQLGRPQRVVREQEVDDRMRRAMSASVEIRADEMGDPCPVPVSALPPGRLGKHVRHGAFRRAPCRRGPPPSPPKPPFPLLGRRCR